ncbi:hypothetical protein AB0G15_11930 [Streptosporangium sp. NPDC023825]|uniref:DUF7927 domain-containing protein n=1 Tax=Streptosporangium sp. NPDC023825 TaxID=3154909 RepID=UPI00341F08A3
MGGESQVEESVGGEPAVEESAGREPAVEGSANGEPTGGSEVEITKTASPILAKPGQKVTYTVKLRNAGDTARSNFTFTDDLSGLLDDAHFDHDQSATSGTVSFTAPEVTWTGDVAAGQTVTVTYGVTVDDPPAGDLRLSGELVGPEGSNCAAGSADPACGNLGAPGLPLLYVLMTADRETAGPGQVVTYTITVGNVGNAVYPGATLTGELSRVLDDAAYNGDARVTSGTVSYGAPRLAWTGDVPVAETVTITYSVTVGTPATGDGVLDSAVQAPGGGTNCPNPAPWSARLAAPVPGAGLGCAQRVAVEGTTSTGALAPEATEPGDVAVDAKPGSDCPAGSSGPGCERRPVETASAPAAADGSATAPEPDSAPIPAPGSVPEPAPIPDPGSVPEPAPVSGPAQAPASPSGATPVPGPERTPVPARVPSPLSGPPPDPSCVPGRGRSVSVPCPAGWSRVEPAGPSLPFTGLPFWPVLVGLLLSGLGLVPRLCARRGRP